MAHPYRIQHQGLIVEVTLDMVQGRLEPIAICVEDAKGKPLTATRHRIRFGEVVEEARDLHLKKLRHVESLARKGSIGADAPASKVATRAARQADELEQRPKKPGRPVYVDDAFLAEVADIYKAAWADRKNPTVAVRDHFRVSQATAARYVFKARHSKLKLLPRTKPGRPKGNGKKR
jgi:hypothetical protein